MKRSECFSYEEMGYTEIILCYYYNIKKVSVILPRREAGGFLMSLRLVWNLKTVSVIPFFYICISSLVLLPSPVALSVLSFSAFGPFS